MTTAAEAIPTAAETVDISGRAMLVALKISQWTARRLDREISNEVARLHGSDPDQGSFWKRLVPKDNPEHKALVKIVNAARADHYANTLPWTDEGWRLLPTANYLEYSRIMRGHAAAFEAAREAFFDVYWDVIQDARTRLNGLYRESDYPFPSDLRGRFRFALDFSPLPAKGDFRLDLPSAELDRIGAAVEDRVTRATREAMQDAWTRLSDTVGKMRDRLSDPDAIFRDTLVQNVRDLVDTLTRLNLTNDPTLEAMRAKVESDLTRHEPATLREDKDTRKDVATKADEIFREMSAFMERTEQ